MSRRAERRELVSRVGLAVVRVLGSVGVGDICQW